MKRLALSCTALISVASTALAADLPAVAPTAVLSAPAFSWSGFYIGAHAGYLKDDVDAGLDSTGGLVTPAAALGFIPSSLSAESDGAMVGGQIGVNMQFGMLVAGMEADLSYTDIGTARGLSNNVIAGTARTSMDAFGTVRGRLGIGFDRILIFATGGTITDPALL